MPPETIPTPLPTDRAKSARQYLESEGLVSRVPSIRSSDYSSALSDPFGYYIRRRLGLIPALSYSEALSRGSYFHTLFALYDRDDRWQIFKRQCAARLTEINNICKDLRIAESHRADAVQNERIDQAMASAWYNAFENLPCINGGSALDLLSDNFTKLGYDVLVACNGREAVEMMTEDVAACVLDLKMPELDGIAALGQIKRLHPETPVVMISAHGQVKDAVEAIKQGALDYVMKDTALLDLLPAVVRVAVPAPGSKSVVPCIEPVT